MPLSATNFITKGPVMHQDMLNFFNLFTGVMVDQPVTFKNVLNLGGSQSSTTVPLKVYGALGQTTHLLDLYADPSQANPGWGIGALGLMAWGPGGAAPTDTTLSRIATQNGHASDTAGVLITPYMEVGGNLSAVAYLWSNGAGITGPAANPLRLVANQDLYVNRTLQAQTLVTSPNGGIANQALGPDTARANLLTNGGFEIWQRGNGPFTASGTYTTDRWRPDLTGSDTISISRDTVNIDVGSTASAACVFTLGSGTNSAFNQFLRTIDGAQIAGRTLSVSLRAKTSTANAVRVGINTDGTGSPSIDSAFHSGGGAFETLTTTLTVPTNATFVQIHVLFKASCTVYLDNAMLVVGEQPANYAPLHPEEDLARCLRYYEQVGGLGANWPNITGYMIVGWGWNTAIPIYRKAVTPTVTKVGNFTVNNCGQPTVSELNVQGYTMGTSPTATGALSITGTSAAYFVAEANP